MPTTPPKMGLHLVISKWNDQRDRIKTKYLRSGPYTHLHIAPDEDPNTVKWTFTFADLGMCHALKSTSTVTVAPGSPPTYHVNGEPHRSEEGALEAVFGRGQYDQFLNATYAELGVKDQTP